MHTVGHVLNKVCTKNETPMKTDLGWHKICLQFTNKKFKAAEQKEAAKNEKDKTMTRKVLRQLQGMIFLQMKASINSGSINYNGRHLFETSNRHCSLNDVLLMLNHAAISTQS